jgi:hypothetical protein
MKWFEHQTSAYQNKKIRKIEIFYQDRGGQVVMAAIGRLWRLHEIVGNQGLGDDGLDTFSLPRDYGLEVLADDLFCSQDELFEFLELLAEINSIDADSWRDQKIVYLPKLAERADTYTKRQNKIRSEKEQYSNSIRTQSDKVRECVSPQAQAQAQKNEKPSLPKNSYPKEFEEIYFAYPKNRRGSKRAAFLQYQKFRPNIPDNIITVINRQKSEKNKADSLGIFYSEFPDLERWIKKANWEKDPFDFPEGNGKGEQPKVSRNPDCPRCRGSGLYERDRAPDGSPIMSSCNCEREGPNESKTAKPAASTLQSTG